MKKIYLLPNVITAFGLSCGLFAIFKMNMIEPGGANLEILTATAGILILAAFADLLDGAVARVMKAESEFGGIFDCLADAISFGVAPSVIILKSLSLSPGTAFSFLLMTGAMVFSICGVLRLVRFSVMTHQVQSNQELANDNKKNFTGLPIPAAAAAAVSANLFFSTEMVRSILSLSETARAWTLFFVLIVLGYFMVSRWKFPSLKTLRIRVASFQQVFIVVICAVLIFFGILHYFALVFFLISWAYIVTAWALSLARLITGKGSKTLEDFEPAPDDFDSEEP